MYLAGDDLHSFGFEITKGLKWNLQGVSYGRKAINGDVIGVLLDLNKRKMKYSINGEKMGTAYQNFHYENYLYPFISFRNKLKCLINMGQLPMKYKPVSYKSILKHEVSLPGKKIPNWDFSLEDLVEDNFIFSKSSHEENQKTHYFSVNTNAYTCATIDFGQLRENSKLPPRSDSRKVLKEKLSKIKNQGLIEMVLQDLLTKYILLLSKIVTLNLLNVWPIQEEKLSIIKLLDYIFENRPLDEKLQNILEIVQIIYNTPLRTIEALPSETRSHLNATEYIKPIDSTYSDLFQFIIYSIIAPEAKNKEVINFFMNFFIKRLCLLSSNKFSANPWIDSVYNRCISGFSGITGWSDEFALTTPYLSMLDTISNILLKLIFSKKICDYKLLIPIVNAYAISLRSIRSPMKRNAISKISDIFTNLYSIAMEDKSDKTIINVIKECLQCVPLERLEFYVENIIYFEERNFQNLTGYCGLIAEFNSVYLLLKDYVNNSPIITEPYQLGYDYLVQCDNNIIVLYGEINNNYCKRLPKIGDKVRRSKNWKYDKVDGGVGSIGEVIEIKSDGREVVVKWEKGESKSSMRVSNNCYDVEVVDLDPSGKIVQAVQLYFHSGVKLTIENLFIPVNKETTFSGTMEIFILNITVSIQGVMYPDNRIKFSEKQIISGLTQNIFSSRFESKIWSSVTYEGVLTHSCNRGYEIKAKFNLPECICGVLEGSSYSLFKLSKELSGDKIVIVDNTATLTSGSKGYLLGTTSFSNGIHYWEVRIKNSTYDISKMGDIMIGIQPMSYTFQTSKDNFNNWNGYKYVNYRAINTKNNEELYGTFYMKGDTIGVLLDLEHGKLSFIFDGYKYGEHNISELGPCSLNISSDLVKGQIFPSFGLKNNDRSLCLNDKWFSTPKLPKKTIIKSMELLTEVMDHWLNKSNETLPEHFLKRAYNRYLRWSKAKFERHKIRVMGLSVDFDITPSAFERLHTKIRAGDIVQISEYDDVVLEVQEQAVILGVYNDRIWYKLMNAESHGSLGECSTYAWQFSRSEVKMLKVIKTKIQEDNSILPISWEEFLKNNDSDLWPLETDLEYSSYINEICLQTAKSYENLLPQDIRFKEGIKTNDEVHSRFAVLSELNEIIGLVLPYTLLTNKSKNDFVIDGDPSSVTIKNPYPDLYNNNKRRKFIFESKSNWKRYNICEYLRSLKALIFNQTKRKFLREIMIQTSTFLKVPNYEGDFPDQIVKYNFNRIKSQPKSVSQIKDNDKKISMTIFNQIYTHLQNYVDSSFRIEYIGKGHGGQKRFFLAQLKGEGVDDYGGPYRSIYEGLITELQYDYLEDGTTLKDCILPFLIPTQNRINNSGTIGSIDIDLLNRR